MCGILSIISTKANAGSGNLLKACSVIKHRGPDDEGLLTWLPGQSPVVWAGEDTAPSTLGHWSYSKLSPEQKFKVGFGHRRLSILDLSPAGHQPMLYEPASLAITFNGEIYNYLEIKEELENLGHQFKSTTDTEVILHAWAEWGTKCLDKFNGMFAFVILDHKKGELFAVRDRFGVKPLYYYNGASAIYLASEIKQIKTSPDFRFKLDESVAHDYLAYGTCEYGESTFYADIKQVPSGHYLHVNLLTEVPVQKMVKWYTLVPKKWSGSFEDASGKFRELLTDAVRLRLRSDVKVGSCLSGGLDSSSIVCLAAELLKANGDFAGQETVTACYDNVRYDEWHFAQEVIKKTNAHAHQTFPSFRQLQDEMDAFLWHQDAPTGSTSQFSQWAVFKKTHEIGLKVMIDGQGADEQLAGYGGYDAALYTGLMKKAKFGAILDEALHYKKEKGTWPKGFLLAAMQMNLGNGFSKMLPEKLRIGNTAASPEWMLDGHSNRYDSQSASLQEHLLKQVYMDPLPSLLRYEDHNSMAWSVESRTPFMDYRLLEFNLGLPENFVYKRGLRKTILRHAMHNVIPEAIENRRDKMGFVTPEESWLKGEGKEWFKDGIDKACNKIGGSLVDAQKVKNYVDRMIAGNVAFDFLPWRIICFSRWLDSN